MMTIPYAEALLRLSAFQLTRVRPATADPSLAQNVGSMGLVLQCLATEIDEAPGRLRGEIAAMEAILAGYHAHGGAVAVELLDAPYDDGRLSGLAARSNGLKRALIEVEADLEGSSAAWAPALRREILAAYCAWTGAEAA